MKFFSFFMCRQWLSLHMTLYAHMEINLMHQSPIHSGDFCLILFFLQPYEHLKEMDVSSSNNLTVKVPSVSCQDTDAPCAPVKKSRRVLRKPQKSLSVGPSATQSKVSTKGWKRRGRNSSPRKSVCIEVSTEYEPFVFLISYVTHGSHRLSIIQMLWELRSDQYEILIGFFV